MAKVKLGKHPETFKTDVKFTLLDGSEAELTVEYIYRTRKEYGEFVDSIAKKTKREISADVTWSELLANGDVANAKYVMGAAKGWNLDEPFTQKTIEQLASEFPAIIGAILDTYRTAITLGRLGN